MARTTITPDIGLMTTLRPFSWPTIATSDRLNSAQKSALEVMLTLLLSCPRVAGVLVVVAAPVVPPAAVSDTEPEVTRNDDLPSRNPVR